MDKSAVARFMLWDQRWVRRFNRGLAIVNCAGHSNRSAGWEMACSGMR